MAENSIKPRIRFKGYTDAWEQRKLGEVANIQKGQQLGKAEMSNNGAFYVLNGGMEPSGYTNQYNTFANTISISEGGNSCGYVSLNLEQFWSGGHNYTLQNPRIDTFFLYQWLKRHEKGIMALRVGSGLPNIQKSALQDVIVAYPKKSEQRAIAEILNKIDNLITLHQRKYDKFVNIKKALLEKMFPSDAEATPKIRFKGFTDAWEQREFNSIVKRVTEMAATDGLPRVEYEDIVSGQGTLNKDIYKKQSNKVGILFDDGDVLFGKLRPYLKNWLFAAFKGIAVGDFWVLRANNADGEYIYTLLQIDTFQNIANQATGTKMPRADWSLVSKQQFFIPRTIAEQHRIGVVFKQLDNLITLHQRGLIKIQGDKNGKKRSFRRIVQRLF